MTGFNCIRCGNCCRNLVDAYRGCVSDADLIRWQQAGRVDILALVETLDLDHGNLLHTAWVDPVTGDDMDGCPWLVKLSDGTGYACDIEAIKPDHCRAYPEHRSHGLQTGCPGCSPQHSGAATGNAAPVGSTAPGDPKSLNGG